MGFLLSFSRKLYLTQYMHSINSKINDKLEEKQRLTNTITDYQMKINDIGDSDSPAVKKLQKLKAEIEAYEKKVDIEIQKLQTQLQAANTEIQSADQMLQSEIQRSFSYRAA